LADGIHSFMDIFSSAIGYLGIKASKKPADEKHPYGHFKFEVLSGVIITLILFITGAVIIYESYIKILSPVEIKFGYLGFAVMIFSAVVNEIMARIKTYFGEKENSITLISDGFHSRVDVYTSLAVFAGLFLTKYWIFADSVLAFLIGLYIIKESFSLGKEAVDSLLDVSAGSEIEEKIKSIVKERGIEIDSLKTQKKGFTITANLEINMPSDLKIEEATKISESLREELIKEIENVSYVAIQIKSHNVETGFYSPAFGKGVGWQRRGKFKEEFEKAEGKGPGGNCICPKCGYKIPHREGVPCSTLQCPNCKNNLERK
jgi:cation diffusion facilitator family transporter